MLLMYVCIAVVLLATLISLGQQPKSMKRLTGIMLIMVTVLGVAFYGYGYYSVCNNIPQAVARTMNSIASMFAGKNDIKEISTAPLFETPGMLTLLYATHFAALYCTGSAVIQVIGKRLLRLIHLLVIKSGHLTVIYGVNENSLHLVKELLAKRKGTTVFVDSGDGASYDTTVLQMGSILFNDPAAQKADAAFLRRIGIKPGKRKMTLYCLDKDVDKNETYAEAMRNAITSAGIFPEQTELIAILPTELDGEAFQNSNHVTGVKKGFGNVRVLEAHDVVSRLMIRMVPPYRTISFDEKGQAKESFEALIVGFGKSGQSVLRALLMNGQFSGSNFHATVIAPDVEQQKGAFVSCYKGITDNYNIEFLNVDARSAECYALLEKLGRRIKYVALCTGREEMNRELAHNLEIFFSKNDIIAPIMQCTLNGVQKNADEYGPAQNKLLYSFDVLGDEELEQMAKIINHQYHLSHNDNGTIESNWKNCDYFSRMSCRSSADFCDAFLYIAGTDHKTVLNEGFSPKEELLETLAATEHERWCAFHYAMGYLKMPDEVWSNRANRYMEEVREKGSSAIRIGKDTIKKQHACLIPWKQLDELSEKEEQITGVPQNYKQYDRDNVRMIAQYMLDYQNYKAKKRINRSE